MQEKLQKSDYIAKRFNHWSHLYLVFTQKTLETLGIIALASMVIINTSEIFFRAVANESIQWTHELTIILAVFIYFAVYATIAKDRSYIRLEVFDTQVLSFERSAAIIGGLLVIGFHLLLVVLSFQAAKFASLFETPILHLPESVFLVPLVIGCGDIVISELIHLIRNILGFPVQERVQAGILT